MNRVTGHTAYLLRRCDCVVLPGWGALIAMRSGAHIDSESGVLVPPSRTLTFNSMIDYNDGMLASSVARKEGISYNAANALVSAELDEMRRRLIADRRLSLARIGTFTLNGDDCMEFSPADCGASNDAYSMLRPVAVPLTDAEAAVHSVTAVRHGKSGTVYLPLSRNIFKIAASLMMLFSLGWMVFSSVELPGEPARASFVPASAPHRQTPAAPPVVEEIASADIIEHEEPETGMSALRNVADDPYCLVIASLGSQSELDKYLSMTDETAPLGVSRHGSRYRVYIATGRSIEEAMAQRDIEEVGVRHPEAWATRR